jgi:hypothetical protein
MLDSLILEVMKYDFGEIVLPEVRLPYDDCEEVKYLFYWRYGTRTPVWKLTF